MTINGVRYPEHVDLANQFPAKQEVQEGGSCHIYTAANLFTWKCSDLIHKKVNISEAFLFYVHLRKKLLAQERHNFFREADEGLVSPFDGGFAEVDMQNIQSGYVVQEKEFPSIQEFTTRFRDLIGHLARVNKKKAKRMLQSVKDGRLVPDTYLAVEREMEARLNRRYIEELDKYAYAHVPKCRTSGDGTCLPDTQDSDLNACLDHLSDQKPVTVNYSFENAIDKLAQRKPFACHGKFPFYYGDDWGNVTTEWGMHVVTVIGYRAHPGFKNGVEFEVRDSNSTRASWGWNGLPCETMTSWD